VRGIDSRRNEGHDPGTLDQEDEPTTLVHQALAELRSAQE
jgi:hypothetical protein